jgi:hypothetical protein
MDAKSWLFFTPGHQCKAQGRKDAVHRLNVSRSWDLAICNTAQDIVETSRETYEGLICDRSSLRIKLGELKHPPPKDLEECYCIQVAVRC